MPAKFVTTILLLLVIAVGFSGCYYTQAARGQWELMRKREPIVEVIDDPDTPEVEVFHTFFATNHKYYGFADLFLNIPVHTGGLGLQDLAAKTSQRLTDASTLAVDVHTFRTAQEGTLGSRNLANELDVTFNYRHTDNLALTAGWSQVFMGDALLELGRFEDDVTFVYVMLNGVF